MARTEITTNEIINVTNTVELREAIEYVAYDLDLRGGQPIIQCADNSYGAVQLLDYVGGYNPDPGAVNGDPSACFTVPVIRGNPANPSAVLFDSGSDPFNIAAVSVSKPWAGFHFKMQGAGSGLLMDWGSSFYCGNIITDNDGIALDAKWHSRIEIIRDMPMRVLGGMQSFARANNGSNIVAQGNNLVAIESNPAFAQGFGAGDPYSIVDLQNCLFFGSKTGNNSRINGGTVIYGASTPGANNAYFPVINASQNDWTPGGNSHVNSLIYVSANCNLTGMGGQSGNTVRTLRNIGTDKTLTLKHEDSASSVNNRLNCGGADFALVPGGSATFIYNTTGPSSSWRWIKQ